VIVKDFNLQVSRGEFVCVIGHSGCGKSTVLSIAMGLNEATEGGVIVDGREVVGPGLDRGVVFQSPALLPWLTAQENVLLAVEEVKDGSRSDRPVAPRWSRSSRKKARANADKYLTLVGLHDVVHSYPDQLSAGMRQRVGIARAFALEPKVLLLDEPFSLLDVITRMELQDELMRLWETERNTVLMVTHDVDEALLLADRIVLMTNGPAATVGEIVSVPFARPRDRLKIAADPLYERIRCQLITFLEERASPRGLPLRDQNYLKAPAGITEDELFVIEKYTGFNRFRSRYRQQKPVAKSREGGKRRAGSDLVTRLG
jgi:nitrate/nitrite transport system ATP-binding protein